MKSQSREPENDECEQATFRPNRAASEPPGTMHLRTEQVPGGDISAVRHTKDETFGVVPRKMESDGKPQIARPAQHQAGQQSNREHADQTQHRLTGIPYMSDSQNERGDNCRRPETNRTCQRELRVSANREFLEDAREYEHQRPQHPEAQQGTGW